MSINGPVQTNQRCTVTFTRHPPIQAAQGVWLPEETDCRSGKLSDRQSVYNGRVAEASSSSNRAAIDLRVEHGRRTRRRLIEVGRELFGTHGYDGTSIGAILDAAGVARGALYHHFASKEALFDTVLTEIIVETADAAAAAARDETDPLQQLHASCRVWLRLAIEPAVRRISLIDGPAVVGWTRLRALDEQYLLGGLNATLRELADDGRLPAGAIELFAHMILASLSEAALFIAFADDPQSALPTGEQTIALLLDRLLSPGVELPSSGSSSRGQ